LQLGEYTDMLVAAVVIGFGGQLIVRFVGAHQHKTELLNTRKYRRDAQVRGALNGRGDEKGAGTAASVD